MKKKIAQIIGDLFAKRQYNKIIRNIHFGNPRNILDVGGSSGILARKIKNKIKNVDYNILELKRESIIRGKKANPDINFILGNAEKMPFKKKEFDLVVCKDVLHHCENPKKVVSEIKRVSNNYVIIEARRGDRWLDYYLPGHNHFSINEFKKLVDSQKFYFLDILWPKLRLMPLFLIFPVIPKSKNSFMVAASNGIKFKKKIEHV